MAVKTAFEAATTAMSLTVDLQICGNRLGVCGMAFKSLGIECLKRGKKGGGLLQLNEG
jgi:hypothetical protein